MVIYGRDGRDGGDGRDGPPSKGSLGKRQGSVDRSSADWPETSDTLPQGIMAHHGALSDPDLFQEKTRGFVKWGTPN